MPEPARKDGGGIPRSTGQESSSKICCGVVNRGSRFIEPNHRPCDRWPARGVRHRNRQARVGSPRRAFRRTTRAEHRHGARLHAARMWNRWDRPPPEIQSLVLRYLIWFQRPSARATDGCLVSEVSRGTAAGVPANSLPGGTFVRQRVLSADLVGVADVQPLGHVPDGHSAETGRVFGADHRRPVNRGDHLRAGSAGWAPAPGADFPVRRDGRGAGAMHSFERLAHRNERAVSLFEVPLIGLLGYAV